MLKFGAALVLISPIIVSGGASSRCDQADYTFKDGDETIGFWREALNLCFSSDKYQKSFKFVYDAAENIVKERLFQKQECEGAFTVQRGAKPDSVPTSTSKTCESFGFIAKKETFNSQGNLVDTAYGVYEDEGGRYKPNPSDVDYIWFSSILYGDCFPYWPGNWAKITGCTQNRDGEGKDVLHWQWYEDKECTEERAPGDYVKVYPNVEGKKDLEATYTKDITEDAPHYLLRKVTSQDHINQAFEVTAQDVICVFEEKKVGVVPPVEVNYPQMYEPKPQPKPYYEPQPYYEEPQRNYEPRYQPQPRPNYNGNYGAYNDANWWNYIALNVLVSVVTTLCCIAVCLTGYQCMNKVQLKRKDGVKWAKVHDIDIVDDDDVCL